MRVTRRRRLTLLAASLMAMSALVVSHGALSAVAAAPTAPPQGSSGYDIGWPQCSTAYPQDGAFGIVGVSNGRAWSANPCLASEYQWAAARPRTPDLYMNTANPAPHSSYYWPASGAHDPALCQDAALTTDPGCAYDYGWHTAADALGTATRTLGSQAVGMWWLDVETGNTWNGDTWSNAADVQGSIDYLVSQHVGGVGVYSTGYQWTTITGGYSTTSAASYASRWSPEFRSPNGISGSPSWAAGASGAADAPSYCSSSFLGTSTWLSQYVSGAFDVNYSCGAASPTPTPTPTTPPTPTPTPTPSPTPAPTADYSISSPSSVSAATGATQYATITVTSSHGWSGSVGLSVSAPAGVTATLSTSTLTVASGQSSSTTLALRSGTAGTYRVTVTGQPAAGSSSAATRTTTTSFAVSGRKRR